MHRPSAEEFLLTLLDTMGFPKDFTGKTVLDIGAYDGFFSFEAERRGAKRVLATDRHPIDHCGFAVAHELKKSKVEYAVASVFDLDPAVHGKITIIAPSQITVAEAYKAFLSALAINGVKAKLVVGQPPNARAQKLEYGQIKTPAMFPII
jgi:predicted nicotinamide N-methyase